MANVFIINGHQPYPFSKGTLNNSFVELAVDELEARGHDVQLTATKDDYSVNKEIEKHLWADVILVQSPVNWMMPSWSFKKYIDDVYTAGMMGKLCQADGRSSAAPKANYGGGGLLQGKKYMLSLTLNAPEEAFNNPAEYLFQGKNVDDLWFPMHMNFRFFAMEGLPTFASYDVMKNPDIETDKTRFVAHLNEHIG